MQENSLKGIFCTENAAHFLVLRNGFIHTLKPQEPMVLDGHQESELVKILETCGFRLQHFGHKKPLFRIINTIKTVSNLSVQ